MISRDSGLSFPAMSDLRIPVNYKSVKCVSWKSTIRILFSFPIFHQQSKETNQSERKLGKEPSNWRCFSSSVMFFYHLICTWVPSPWKACSARCKSVAAKTRLSRKDFWQCLVLFFERLEFVKTLVSNVGSSFCNGRPNGPFYSLSLRSAE